MLHIIQSNKIEKLFAHLLAAYRHPDNKASVFEPFNVIVPSKVMGEWLKKQVADQAGISTLVTTEFWGRYLLTLMQRVLRTYARFRDDILDVPEVAMLSKNVMQWQIFGLLMAQQAQIMADDSHPLYRFVAPSLEASHDDTQTQSTPIDPQALNATQAAAWATNQSLLASSAMTDTAHHQSTEQRLWQLANDMASMLNRYMTYRPHWLDSWGKGEVVNTAELIAEKDALHNRLQGRRGDDAITTPAWLVEHYVQLEAAQRYLWQHLFDDDYRYRETLHKQFWQAFEDKDARVAKLCRDRLPKQLILFTVQQLPPTELLDLQRLGALTEVTLLHFNPSQQFWADIVDKNWLLQEQLNHPESVALKDYGHTLLSRFGKQSREVFAMLANLSGNAYQQIDWQDDFVELDDTDSQPKTLLQHIQQDILMLEERETQSKIRDMLTLIQTPQTTQSSTAQVALASAESLQKIQQAGIRNPAALQRILDKLDNEYLTKQRLENQRHWQASQLIDSSLSIHACHSMVRQLEVLRGMLVGWLNYTDKPDEIPENVFMRRSLSDVLVLLPDIDAQQNIIEAIFPKGVGADGYTLPAKVTGVVAKDINQLWQAIMGYYQLLNRAGARFSRSEVFDWLMLPPLYESFGLSLEQMSRGCELLMAAGFIRGFDEAHLQQSLHEADDDYRYSFAYALERLVAGLLMPQAQTTQFGSYTNRHGHVETIAPLAGVSMDDASIIAVLCEIFDTLDQKRDMGRYVDTVAAWLEEIESLIKAKFALFAQTNALLAIFAAQNAVKRHIEANYKKPTAQQDLPDQTRVDTENLPFKLGFILDSLANELVSQQVSAEPAGVITFARIGAVRNLPYKLVVMLNLNLSDFPQREQHNRYNLMQAGIPSRGDRFREDDDLGAFLDAILCAQEACWLFYNGKSTIDTHEHLPASPVQELLSFLQSEVQWQQDSLDQDLANNSLSKLSNPTNDDLLETLADDKDSDNSTNVTFQHAFAQQVADYLVTHHPALPFDKSYFQPVADSDTDSATPVLQQQLQRAKSQLYPPASIWHTLYQQLNHPSNPLPKSHQGSYQHKADEQDAPVAKVDVWDKPTLADWLVAWQHQQNTLNSAPLTASSDSVYENLTSLIRGMQQPAQLFIQHQRLYLPTAREDDQTFEALLLDPLQRYQVNDILIRHALSDDSDATALMPTQFDSVLPAGVNRYQSLTLQRRKLNADLKKFITRLQDIAHREGQNFSGLKTFITHHFGHQTDAVTNLDEPSLYAMIAKLMTPCEEQRVAIDAVDLDAQAMPTATPLRFVITANLPKPASAKNADNPSTAWLHYLPTSGRDKYLVQFWLNHLCWQVARQTSPAQVSQDDGFSLWQYSHQKTFYLPPISCDIAKGYLQDWLMAWQLGQGTPLVLPPTTAIYYTNKIAESPDSKPSDWLKNWLPPKFGDGIDGENFAHASWQFILASQTPQVIVPFLQTMGEALYQPIVSHVMVLNDDKK